MVLASAPNNARLRLEQEARRQKIILNVAWEVNPVHLAKEMVVTERLYMMATRLTVAAEVAAGVLAAIPIVMPEIQQTFYLVVAGRRNSSAAVRAVAQIVEQLAAAAEQRPGSRPIRALPGALKQDVLPRNQLRLEPGCPARLVCALGLQAIPAPTGAVGAKAATLRA